VQEPGANDNASGVGLQLELARAWKKLIDEGKLPRPTRTITFLWGAEMTMVRLWAAANPEQMLQVRAGLVLDMVGQNPAKTGGIMRVEKTPDPSAIYSYGSDVLPGAEVSPPADRFVRGPDQHTLWGKGRLRFEPYPGFFLNDLYFAAGELVTRDSPGFEVGSNPWEGGSDHDPFLWHRHDEEAYPIPAVLTWHFTDFFYHSSHDTMDKVSGEELRNVGLLTLNVGAIVANAGADEAMEVMRLVERSGLQRMEWERRNSVGHLEWAKQAALDGRAAAGGVAEAIDDALELEREILNAWAVWYREAIASAGVLCGTAADRCAEAAARHGEAIDEALEQALQHAERLAERLKTLPA